MKKTLLIMTILIGLNTYAVDSSKFTSKADQVISISMDRAAYCGIFPISVVAVSASVGFLALPVAAGQLAIVPIVGSLENAEKWMKNHYGSGVVELYDNLFKGTTNHIKALDARCEQLSKEMQAALSK